MTGAQNGSKEMEAKIYAAGRHLVTLRCVEERKYIEMKERI